MTNGGFSAVARDPVLFARRWLSWDATDEQASWLRGSVFSDNWNRSGNRWGKTEATAVKHLWKCAFKKRSHAYGYDLPYVTINCALSLDQASLALTKAWRLVNRPEGMNFRRVFVKRKVETPFPRIEFRNGSVFWARSTAKRGDYLHGHDYDYVSYDEGALDPDFGTVCDEVIYLRLADRGGQLDLISTGKKGSEFNRRYAEAKLADKFTFQGSTLSNPHIDKEAISRYLASMPERLIQERIYGGEPSADGLLSSPHILASVRRGIGLTPPVVGHRYITGVDLGRKQSMTTIVTTDVTHTPYQLVAYDRFNEHDIPQVSSYWKYVYATVRARHKAYGGMFVLDATGLGDVVADELIDIGAQPLVLSGPTRTSVFTNLQLAFELGLIGIPALESMRGETRVWSFVDELEALDLDSPRHQIDMSIALALSLWPVREWLKSPLLSVLPRVQGMRR